MSTQVPHRVHGFLRIHGATIPPIKESQGRDEGCFPCPNIPACSDRIPPLHDGICTFQEETTPGIRESRYSKWIKLHGTSICMAPRPDDSVPYRLPEWHRATLSEPTRRFLVKVSAGMGHSLSYTRSHHPLISYGCSELQPSNVFHTSLPSKPLPCWALGTQAQKKSHGSLSCLILSGTVSAGELCMPKCSPSKLRCFVLSSKWEPGRTCRRFGNALPAPVHEMDWNMVSKQDGAPRIRKIKHGHGSKKKAGLKLIGR